MGTRFLAASWWVTCVARRLSAPCDNWVYMEYVFFLCFESYKWPPHAARRITPWTASLRGSFVVKLNGFSTGFLIHVIDPAIEIEKNVSPSKRSLTQPDNAPWRLEPSTYVKKTRHREYSRWEKGEGTVWWSSFLGYQCVSSAGKKWLRFVFCNHGWLLR